MTDSKDLIITYNVYFYVISDTKITENNDLKHEEYI